MILHPGLPVGMPASHEVLGRIRGKNKDFNGNYRIYEYPPPQGLFRGTAGLGGLLEFFSS
jgi:hypothetical protein